MMQTDPSASFFSRLMQQFPGMADSLNNNYGDPQLKSAVAASDNFNRIRQNQQNFRQTSPGIRPIQQSQNGQSMSNLVTGPSGIPPIPTGPMAPQSRPQMQSLSGPAVTTSGMQNRVPFGGRNFSMGADHGIAQGGYAGNMQPNNPGAAMNRGMGLGGAPVDDGSSGGGNLWDVFNRLSGNPSNNNLIY